MTISHIISAKNEYIDGKFLAVECAAAAAVAVDKDRSPMGPM